MKISVDQSLLKAKSHARNGEIAEAEELYRTILAKFPGNKRARQGLAALNAVPKIKASAEPAQDQIKALVDLFNRGQLQAVAKQASLLAEEFPQAFVLFNILGAANAGLRHFDAAIESYSQALKIKPDYADAHNNLGDALQKKGDLTAAIDSFKHALQFRPDYVEASYNLGIALTQSGDLSASIESFNHTLKLKPDYGKAHYNLGNALKDNGDPEGAIESYRRALQIKPDNAEAHNNLGNALHEKGELEGAIESYRCALRIKPDYAEAHFNLAVALGRNGDFTAAIENYNHALKIKPDYADAYNNLGDALKNKGDLLAAVKCLKLALQIKPDFTECYRNYSTIVEFKRNDPFIAKMKMLLSADDVCEKDMMHLHFALAKVEQDLGNYEFAANHLIKGNALKKKELVYDISQDTQLFAEIKRFFDSNGAKRQTDVLIGNPKIPVFILGMPRSGTSLVEQIISSHSSVFGAGELGFLSQAVNNSKWQAEKDRKQIFSALRSFYAQKISALADAAVITDKTPLNFRWIGFIVNSLPEAKIVHLQRDPAAVCWSNFKKYFPSNGMAFTFDRQDVAHYYRLYENLMAYWQQKYPTKIFNLSYERLTENQEEETRRLFDYLELSWEDNLLEFHKNERNVRTASTTQVRREMYQGSSLEWKRHEQWLQPMLEILTERV